MIVSKLMSHIKVDSEQESYNATQQSGDFPRISFVSNRPLKRTPVGSLQ